MSGHMLRGILDVAVGHTRLATREAALARLPALQACHGPPEELHMQRQLGFDAGDVDVRFTTDEEKLGGTWAWSGHIRTAD